MLSSQSIKRCWLSAGTALAWFIGPAFAAPADASTVAEDATCCKELSSVLSSKLALPGSEVYETSLGSYWAANEQAIQPDCIVVATDARDVSETMKVLVAGGCEFAVRAGGHGSVTGVANIGGGVTIDLSALNATELNDDKSLATIGPGQRWHGVYSTLASDGLTVTGTRAAGVGVAGSTTGGGLGYIAPSAGFAADNVVKFEVVLADGSIVSATEGNNTPLGDVWGGDITSPAAALDAEAQAFYNFVSNPNYDDKAQTLMTYTFVPSAGGLIVNQHIYAEPIEDPPAFAEFLAIEGEVEDTTAITNVTALSEGSQARSPGGLQQVNFATTFRNDEQTLRDSWAVFEASFATVASLKDLSWSLTFVPLVESLHAQSVAKGGNVLGLEPPPEGLVQVLLSASCSQVADYDALRSASDDLLDGIVAKTKENGVFHPYVDMNHAKADQDVIASYGQTNDAFIKDVANTYDPAGVFQHLMPGGFKL